MSFSIFYNASRCPWGPLKAAPNPPERIHKSPGHPSIFTKKGCFSPWMPEKVCCGKMPRFLSVSNSLLMCFDNVVCDWWGPLWSTTCCCAAEEMELRVTTWQKERAVSDRFLFFFFFYLVNCGMESNYLYVPTLTYCVCICLCVLCVPGLFHQRTQLWMRMMCTGALRSWQSKYALTHTHKNTHSNLFLSLRRTFYEFKLIPLNHMPRPHPNIYITIKRNPNLKHESSLNAKIRWFTLWGPAFCSLIGHKFLGWDCLNTVSF